MNLSSNSFKLTLTLIFLVLPFFSTQAADFSVKCDKKSLASVIGKLDKSETNTIYISSDCNEDIVVSDHKDLSLIGVGGASLSATSFLPGDFQNSTLALLVENSHITVQTLTINPGQGISCTSRSTCVFRDVSIMGGHGGIGFQDQSTGDILGSTTIQNSIGSGLGIFGASTVNVRPDPWVTGNEAGPEISGNAGPGVYVFDNSYLRTDNVTISNNGFGVYAQRESVLKIIGGEVNDNLNEGIIIFKGGSLQAASTEVSNNGADGIYVGPLAAAQFGGSTILNNGGWSVNCDHSTAVVFQLGGAILDNTNCP